MFMNAARCPASWREPTTLAPSAPLLSPLPSASQFFSALPDAVAQPASASSVALLPPDASLALPFRLVQFRQAALLQSFWPFAF